MKEFLKDYYYRDDGDIDAYLYHHGNNENAHKFLGAHFVKSREGKKAVRFTVWAPNAQYVNLIGDFNNWDELDLPLQRVRESGIWSICVYGVKEFDAYKYRIVNYSGEVRYKADPVAFHAEERPKTASKVYAIEGYEWQDAAWMKKRQKRDPYTSPMAIYEVNLSSWKKKPDGNPYSYRELAHDLVDYVKQMGYTHVELMPITEYPYEGSWGYQATGYFAPTSRFGTPKDFMALVDAFHQKDIGVILDWVPGHFCRDDFGLARFDGSNCYEYNDQYRADNEQWGTLNFDLGKPEVQNFLISSAIYWHEYYHIDGLRVDAVAYMLYLNFTGKDIHNDDGSNENRQAIEFLKKLNTTLFKLFPDTMMIAEESTAWPLLTMPVSEGGLGFNFKWNMGWMNDTLTYFEMDPYFRKDHHDKLTFSIMYAFSENFILPFSHDEVVHMKGSMIGKMPGDYDMKFRHLRLLYAYMYAHPGKKLMFMGDEIAQFDEWNEWAQITFEVLEYEKHQKMQDMVKALNKIYKKEAALYDQDNSYDGFLWEDVNNAAESILCFERISRDGEKIIAIFNMTPVPRPAYPIGVDQPGLYSVLLNTDAVKYGGGTQRNKAYRAEEMPHNARPYRLTVDVPPLSALWIKYNKTAQYSLSQRQKQKEKEKE